MLITKDALIEKIAAIERERQQNIADANAKRGAILVLQQVLAEEEAAEREAAKVVPVLADTPVADPEPEVAKERPRLHRVPYKEIGS